MKKERIKGKNGKAIGNTESFISLVRFLISRILPVIILIVAVFYMLPYASMHFQNNDVKALNAEARTVMFYKSDCSACQKVYPIVFWHNVLKFQQPENQIQTINVQNPSNEHYINDYQIQETPTLMKIKDSNQRVVPIDKKQIIEFTERIQ